MVCGVCCAEPILFWFPLSFLVYRVDTRDRGAAGVGASAWRSENAVSSEVPPMGCCRVHFHRVGAGPHGPVLVRYYSP